ncbi:MAG: hypothetical protein JW919_03790 [Candidatus Omnitrophica bacterium]|nr:hypothetical protein [Candidatus Omnitrophota bacterium]
MFSEPVVGERFFGREEVLDLLNKRVLALKEGYRQNVALTGQSLAGKSSILLHFLATVKDEPFIPVYLEVVKEPFRSFANRFIATLLYNTFAKTGEAVEIDMGSLLEKASKALPKTHGAVRHVMASVERGEYDEAYTSLLNLTSIVKEEAKIPCIVIFDEFDNLEQIGIKNTFLNFGKIIMVQKNTMYIVSSSRNHAIKKILSEKLSLLFGNFEIVKVSGFDTKKAGEFLEIKLAGYEADDDIKRFIISFTDGNPFYLNHIAARLEGIAAERMSSHIDSAVVEQAILDLVYNSNGVIHQYLLNYVLDLLDSRSREICLPIMVAIARGKNRQQEIARAVKAQRSEISKALERLLEQGFISKNGVFYRIDDVMLEFWLRHVYQKRRDLLIDDAVTRSRLFESELRAYMEDALKEYRQGVTPRIADLFGSFSNELMQIDARQMRLPHFTRVEVRALNGSKPCVVASFRGKTWVVQPYETYVGEGDIVEYMRSVKALDRSVAQRIIMPLKGIDENANLLAKELKIAIWETPVVNMLLTSYGKKRTVTL